MRAIGYVSKTLAGDRRSEIEHQMWDTATRFGIELTMIAYAEAPPIDQLERLETLVRTDDPSYVFVPDLAHLGDIDPVDIDGCPDVYLLAEQRLYTIYLDNEEQPEGTPRIIEPWTGPGER
ncbi:hypothetical protein [Nocardia sp. NPDC056100]|uniref:hypothetical protein n=1 Tax=Nocardia sp. NPDC056100 TaxID=3345712 RepID=UPI0035D81279